MPEGRLHYPPSFHGHSRARVRPGCKEGVSRHSVTTAGEAAWLRLVPTPVEPRGGVRCGGGASPARFGGRSRPTDSQGPVVLRERRGRRRAWRVCVVCAFIGWVRLLAGCVHQLGAFTG